MSRVLNTGIGVGIASSIPQFNLTEVCEKVAYLLDNPSATHDELYCPPDFATGAILANASEVKESIRLGSGGKSAILRSVMEYDEDEHCFVVTELPYGVTGRRVILDINKGIEEGSVTGVKRTHDATDRTCGPLKVKIYIYLDKDANVHETARRLYNHTCLQSNFSINMNMLKEGKFPRVFSWTEMMQEYVAHLTDVVRKSMEFDIRQLAKDIEILDGYMIAINNIDEIVAAIRASDSDSGAISTLMEEFNLTEKQAQAVTRMQLRRLIGMNAIKTQKELDAKNVEMKALTFELEDEVSFKNKLKDILQDLVKRFGDERRTKVMELNTNLKEEIIEETMVTAYFTNYGNIMTKEMTSLVSVNRGSKGRNLKFAEGEKPVARLSLSNLSTIVVFTNYGTAYNIEARKLPVDGTINISEFLDIDFAGGEKLVTVLELAEDADFLMTTNTHIKRTPTSEYTTNRKAGIKAMDVGNSELIDVVIVDAENDERGEYVVSYTVNGKLQIVPTTEYTTQGRATKGSLGMNVDESDKLQGLAITHDSTELVIVTMDGLVKRTDIDNFTVRKSKRSKGVSAVNKTKQILKVTTVWGEDDSILVVADGHEAFLKVGSLGIPVSRTAAGNKLTKGEVQLVM